MHGLTTALLLCVALGADLVRTEHFDADPKWDAHNNRLVDEPGRETVQNFGYSATNFVGGKPGEVGGAVQTAAERACYGKPLVAPLTFDSPLRASGKLAFAPGHATGPVLVGFFNAANSFSWRTRNSLAMRIDGRGDVLHAHVEYCTDKWRAGAGMLGSRDESTGRFNAQEFPATGVHTWSIDYDPNGADGHGAAVFTFDGQIAEMTLDEGHKADGAVFDRFGMMNVMKSSDNRLEVYLDDVTINGATETFDADPHWIEDGSRHTYTARIVRPWFDFGYSPTSYAGGAPGELGGVIFRGDYRSDRTKAYYGGRTGDLSLAHPLHATGRVRMLRGVSDSGVLIGWFNATKSLEGGTGKSTIPQDFLGVFIEGPSRDGFMFRPAYRMHGEENGVGIGPIIFPDGEAQEWSVEFTPGDNARIAITLGGASAELALPGEQLAHGASFDHFGIITTQIDGNCEIIYFDDLTYTAEQ